MSWDVYIFAPPAGVDHVEDIPSDYSALPLGTVADIQQRIRDRLPEAGFAEAGSVDAGWGGVSGPGWNIEINLGSEDPVVGFMLHIRGSGDDVLPVAARIAASAGGRAWDIPGERFLSGDPTETDGWHGFQRYRDQILGDG
jgi:hypothetical protein